VGQPILGSLPVQVGNTLGGDLAAQDGVHVVVLLEIPVAPPSAWVPIASSTVHQRRPRLLARSGGDQSNQSRESTL
jgi:hypothetical protein